MGSLKLNDSASFWSHVDKSGGPDSCWTWKGQYDRYGYGKIRWPGYRNHRLTHQVAYELTHGSVPKGKEVCHSCDNPACCNGNHLFAGTHKQNMEDRDAKGRNLKRVKLTLDKVNEIRRRYASTDTTQQELANQYGVCKNTIHRVVSGITWK